MSKKYKRLTKIKDLIRENERVVDIGTDHAILPVMLVKEKITRNITATEVAEGPYNIAKEYIYKNKLEDVIKLIRSDGFESVSNRKFDTIVIAGMGGQLIKKILSLKGTKFRQRLILHATNNIHIIRKKISKMGYSITNEYLILEGKVNNIIIEADRNIWNTRLTKKEIYFGPSLIKKAEENHIEIYFKQQLEHYRLLDEKANKKEFKLYIKWLEKILNEKR